MRIKFHGHACFSIATKDNVKIITDPYDDTVGYPMPEESEADIVTTSHDHFDHNYIEHIKGEFSLINRVGDYNHKGVAVKGIRTHHDKAEGKQRGKNIVYTFEVEGLRLCHLGDLGHIPTQEQLTEIGKVDVLLIPVGGVYTIDAKEAVEVIGLLNPSVVIPMHYKTPLLKFNLGTLEEFASEIKDRDIKDMDILEIYRDTLEQYKNKVIVLNIG